MSTSPKTLKDGSFKEPSVPHEALSAGMSVWCGVAPSVIEEPSLLYAKCTVIDPTDPQEVVLREAASSESTFKAKATQLYYCNENYDPMTTADIGLLAHPNAPSVLELLKTRYMNDNIYTLADPLLVSINPFRDLGNCSEEAIKAYGDAANPGSLPPHIFAIARRALDNLNSTGQSQTIVVSGESGAGKTEATKHIMRFFATAAGEVEAGTNTRDLRIQNAVMAANPVLEAFGNAKTVLNDNSSRFGKFMHLEAKTYRRLKFQCTDIPDKVSRGGGIAHGHVECFLLEKSRVVVQAETERSYHIFYQLLAGAAPALREKLFLRDPKSYRLLNPQCTDIPGKDDAADFADVIRGFESMGLDDETIHAVLSIVSGILLLGNVGVGAYAEDGLPDAAKVCSEDWTLLQKACQLLYLEPHAVKEALEVRVTVAGSHEIKGRWTQQQSELLRDSLCKGVYEQLFKWIVRRLNRNITNPLGIQNFIGMLDIFGFEVFQKNSLEQLFINVTNELLQATFVDVVFTRESALYASEGVTNELLTFDTPVAIINLLCAKTGSVLSHLEDSCLSPGGSDAKFTAAIKAQIKKAENAGAAKPGSSLTFTICHSIGSITYDADGFLAKNKDQLHPDLVELLKASPNPVTAELYEGHEVVRGKLVKGNLIGSQFLSQLQSLTAIIEKTEPHFIRCIKPNNDKEPKTFNAQKILPQLRALSVLEALQLRSVGYSYRRSFEDFVKQHRYVLLEALESVKIDPTKAALALLKASGLKECEYRMGKTMVFLTREAQQRLMALQRERLAHLRPLVRTVEAIVRKRALKSRLETHIQTAIRLQAHIRRQLLLLEMRGHAPATQSLPSRTLFAA